VKLVGLFAQVPLVAVTVWPTWAVPEIVGGVVLTGTLAHCGGDGGSRHARRGRAGAGTVRGRDRDLKVIPYIRRDRHIGGSGRAGNRSGRKIDRKDKMVGVGLIRP
jgi:hypothetical protein